MRAAALENDERVRGRLDRTESALTLALFLEYSERHGLSPQETESLLDRPGRDGPEALEALGLSGRPSIVPGRDAHVEPAGVREHPLRAPGR